MDEGRIDPIKYAWGCCNQGVPLPAMLARSASIDSIAARVGGEAAAAKALAAKVAKAATHSGIVRRPMPRTRTDGEFTKPGSR
jgi:hypothetical protein